jgi:thioester reductase-like protein
VARGRHVVALARGRDGEGAQARATRALALQGEGLVEVVEGDLAEPRCGLDDATIRRLRDRIETLVHCAGDPAFFPAAPATYRAGHVDGPCELLERLHGGRLARWAHLSTAYVCGRRRGTVLEGEGDVGQEFRNPYERVKLEAEGALRAAGARLGVDVRVFRPSIVVGDAPETSGGGPSLLVFGLIRLAAALASPASRVDLRVRVPLPPHGRFNVVPLPYVADAIVALAEHPDATGQTFHLVVSDPPTNREVVRHIARRFGLEGVTLIDPRATPFDAPTALERTIARILAGYRDYLAQDVRFDDRNARRLLAGAGVDQPGLSAETIDRLIDQAVGRAEADASQRGAGRIDDAPPPVGRVQQPAGSAAPRLQRDRQEGGDP